MRRSINVTAVLVTLLGLMVLTVAPVAADDSTATTTNQTTMTDCPMATTGGCTTTSETGTMPMGTDEASHVQTQIAQMREQALQTLQNERKNMRTHTEAERQQACVAHQAELDTRIGNYSREAQNNLNVFSGIFTKVQAFYTSKQLNVSNYATLSATVTTDQSAAQQAVDALSQLSGTKIDCTQPDPAQTVAVVKNAVDTARTALQTYRQSIKALIVALEGASTAHSDATTHTTTTTGGNQ